MSKIVFSNGNFDVLHVGHFNLLSYCRQLAGKDGQVYVAIDLDEKVKLDKGPHRPIYPHSIRRQQLLDLTDSNGKSLVDKTFLFSTNEQLYEMIKREKPNIIVKGSDWKGNVIGSDLAEVVLFPRIPYSSTEIIQKIQLMSHSQIETSEDEWMW